MGNRFFGYSYSTEVADGIRLNEELVQLLDEDNLENVYVVVDGEKLEKSPRLSMTGLKSIFSGLQHPKLAWFIAVGNVSRANSLMGILLTRVFGLNYRQLPSFEAAMDFLRQRDASLKWDQADESLLKNSEADAGS